MWHLYTVDGRSVVQRNEADTHYPTWLGQKHKAREGSQSQETTCIYFQMKCPALLISLFLFGLFFFLFGCRGCWLLTELKPSVSLAVPSVCSKAASYHSSLGLFKFNLKYSALPRWFRLISTNNNYCISLLQLQYNPGGLLRNAKGPEPQLAAPSYYGLRFSHVALLPAANSHICSQDCLCNHVVLTSSLYEVRTQLKHAGVELCISWL